MQTPIVSIIVTTFNRSTLVLGLVESIKAQFFQAFELIFVDDCSTDNTPLILSSIAKADSRIRIIRNSFNQGPGVARNKGIEIASGKYIAILDDDDLPNPQWLNTLVDILENDESCGAIFSPFFALSSLNTVIGIYPKSVIDGTYPNNPLELFKQLYLSNNDIVNSGIMFRRETLDKVGGYGTFSFTGEDRFLFLKISAVGHRISAYPKPLIHVRVGQERDHLLRDIRSKKKNQVEVVRNIQNWLRQSGIHEFDDLHSYASAYTMANYARTFPFFQGIWMAFYALALQPRCVHAQSTFTWFLHKLVRKLSFGYFSN